MVTLSDTLADKADAAAVARRLRGAPGIALPQTVPGRDRFGPDAPLTTITNLRDGAQGVLMVLKGDNLEAATTGLMQAILAELSV